MKKYDYIRFFNPRPKSVEELKRRYRELAKRYHPDTGYTDEEAMKTINNEYESLFEKLKNTHEKTDGTTFTKQQETNEKAGDYIDIINQLMSMSGIEIEICGSFIWVSGNTYPVKNKLKELGFKWSKNKSRWYLSPPDYKRSGRRTYSMNYIRNKHGSQVVDNDNKFSNMAIG